MKTLLLLLILVVSFLVVGCSSEKQVDDSKPAPKPQFTMVPSQKSGQQSNEP